MTQDTSPPPPSPRPRPPRQNRRVVGYAIVIVLLLGSALVVNAMFDGGWGGGSVSSSAVPWSRDLDTALNDAGSGLATGETRGTGPRLVLAEFTADWCPPCQVMKRNVYSRQDIAEAMTRGFVPVQVDVSQPSTAQNKLMKRYGVYAIPVLLALTPDGREVARVSGAVTQKQLKQWMNQLRQNRTPPDPNAPLGLQAGPGRG